MIVRRPLWSVIALALVVILTPSAPQAQGRGGGPIAALQNQVQALEQQVADLTAALSALGTEVGAGDAALQTQIDAANAALVGLQQLFASLNTAVNDASGDILSLKDRVLALETELAALGDGLTSYDQLADLPCTTASETAGTVNLVGLLKTPTCAEGTSANGRFIDFGLVVLDTQTNLIWEKKITAVGSGQNLADLHDVDNTYTWCVATGNSTGFCAGNATSWIGQVNAEVFAGFSNWRVATRDELLGIVDCSAGAPCIDPIFGPTQAALYWSSTEVGFSNAWLVNFFNGLASTGFKSFEFPVRAVRAGP